MTNQQEATLKSLAKARQREFIKDLFTSLEADILSRLDRIPGDWDGYELRLLVHDRCDDQILWGKVNRRTKRYQDYRKYAIKNFLI